MLRATCKRFVKDDLPGVVFLSEKNSGETNFHSDEDVLCFSGSLLSKRKNTPLYTDKDLPGECSGLNYVYSKGKALTKKTHHKNLHN